MTQDPLVIDIAVLVLAGFVGFAVISKVPNTLHTPLMSGTNAIHGIVVLGGLLTELSDPGQGVPGREGVELVNRRAGHQHRP